MFSLRLCRLVERRRIGGDDPADFVGKVHRDGGEDVMPRAAADQKVAPRRDARRRRALPARRPADDVEMVIVAVPDDVAARVGQPPHDIQMPAGRGPVHRGRCCRPRSRAFTSSPRFSSTSTAARWPSRAAACSSVHSYGFARASSSSGCASSSAVSLASVAASCRVEELPLDRQRFDVGLQRPPTREAVGLARSNCASASRAPGLSVRSSARRRFACLRSQSRSGLSGKIALPARRTVCSA